MTTKTHLTAVEICAGAGGQALGLDMAGFGHAAAVEIDKAACATLRLNRPKWRVFEEDLRGFNGRPFRGVDLLAGGVPCPPFSIAGKQLGPTVVGGSKKHGGPDLGPTRARAQWRLLGVDGRGIANEPPARDFAQDGIPKLTVRMVARVQGFPDSWEFSGKKTAAYRQVGNAFPPPVAKVVGLAIHRAILR